VERRQGREAKGMVSARENIESVQELVFRHVPSLELVLSDVHMDQCMTSQQKL